MSSSGLSGLLVPLQHRLASVPPWGWSNSGSSSFFSSAKFPKAVGSACTSLSGKSPGPQDFRFAGFSFALSPFLFFSFFVSTIDREKKNFFHITLWAKENYFEVTGNYKWERVCVIEPCTYMLVRLLCTGT